MADIERKFVKYALINTKSENSLTAENLRNLSDRALVNKLESMHLGYQLVRAVSSDGGVPFALIYAYSPSLLVKKATNP